MVAISIYFMGLAELILNTLWARYVADSKPYLGGLISMVHIFIWYYVLRTVIAEIDDISIVFAYALGCGSGTLVTIWADNYLKKNKAALKRIKMLASLKPWKALLPATR